MASCGKLSTLKAGRSTPRPKGCAQTWFPSLSSAVRDPFAEQAPWVSRPADTSNSTPGRRDDLPGASRSSSFDSAARQQGLALADTPNAARSRPGISSGPTGYGTHKEAKRPEDLKSSAGSRRRGTDRSRAVARLEDNVRALYVNRYIVLERYLTHPVCWKPWILYGHFVHCFGHTVDGFCVFIVV